MECGIRTAECGILTEDEDNAAWRTANWEYAEGSKGLRPRGATQRSEFRNPKSAFHIPRSMRPKSCFLWPGPHILAVSAGIEIRYKIGNERLVKVTERAAAKLSQLLTRQGRPLGALRVAVIGGGCSGLQYKMDLVDGPANRDILVESNRVRVVVDPKTALFVSGSSVDFSEDLQKGGFKVTNPNAVAHCSCGESFSA
jgi:iron-sulfur cluster assembly protein